MALPSGLPLVTVTAGPYTDFSQQGRPYTGTVTFTPSTPVIWSATGAVLLDGDVTATLDKATGSVTVQLPATDAAGLTVRNFTYTVTWNLRSAGGQAKEILPVLIQLPQAAPVADLDTMTTLSSEQGIQVGLPQVLSVAGLTGAVSLSQLSSLLSVSAGPIDGGSPSSVYAGIPAIDGGTP